jgi:hypothetical protein
MHTSATSRQQSRTQGDVTVDVREVGGRFMTGAFAALGRLCFAKGVPARNRCQSRGN